MAHYNQIPVGLDWANGQHVAYTASSAQSAALAAGQYVLVASTACYITMGENPTASAAADNLYLEPGRRFDLLVTPGQATQKLAAVRVSADGALSILPVL